MTEELREKVARKIEPTAWLALDTHVGGETAAVNRADSLALADRILALPEIAEALALRDLSISQQGQSITEAVAKVNLGHSISTGTVRDGRFSMRAMRQEAVSQDRPPD